MSPEERVLHAAQQVSSCALQRDTAGLAVCETCMRELRAALTAFRQAVIAQVQEAKA